jgi:GT2 family glycosyltransferase
LFTPPISIIIPNYNGSHLLRKNLPSVLEALAHYLAEGVVIVVDDGSSDDSLAVLAENFPQVRTVKHEQNAGFAEAVHSGVNAAQTEILIILNSDVQPDSEFVLPLVQHLQNPQVFSVSPLIFEESGHISDFTLNCYRLRLGRLVRGRESWLQPSRVHAQSSLYALGGSMAVKKSLFLELGGFLPLFKPFYWEDFDLGVRAWRKGWQTRYEPASQVIHQDHGSIRENHARKRIRRALQRNKLLVEWLHTPASNLVWTLVPRLALRLFAKTLIGDIGHLQAVFEAVRKLPEVFQLRKSFAEQGMLDFTEVLSKIEQDNKYLFEGQNKH